MSETSKVSRLVRAHVPSLEVYAGVDPPEVLARRAGMRPDQVVRLNANENPYGPSPRVAPALAAAAAGAGIYPDPLQREVRSAIGAYTGADPAGVVAGAGADELIDLLVRLTLEPGDQAIDLTPTFGMYGVTTRIAGGEVVAVPRDDDFEVDVEAVRREVGPRTKLIFLCNPNNPTGNLSPESCVRELLDLGPLVVVDETYHEFCGFTVDRLVPEHENLVVLRSLSKWAGLSGVRIGYAIMAPIVAGYLMAIKTPYNISIASQAALLASLEDTDLLLQRVRTIVEERERMKARLEGLPGVICYPSKANFVLCRFPAGEAKRLEAGLAERGIIVRGMGDPLQDCLRISAGTPAQTDAVVDALSRLLVS